MALLLLTQSNSGQTLNLDEKDVTRVYAKGSQTVVEYLDNTLSVRKTLGVDETPAAVYALSNNMVSTTLNGATVYLNRNRVLFTNSVNSLAEVSYDMGGDSPDILKLDVTEAVFLSAFRIIEPEVKHFDRTFTQAEIRTFNSANSGYGVELLAAPGAGKVYILTNPVMRWVGTGGSFTTADVWIYFYNDGDAMYLSSVANGTSLPATYFDIPNVNNIRTAAGDGADGLFPGNNEPINIYASLEQSSYEGTMRLQFDYKVLDFN